MVERKEKEYKEEENEWEVARKVKEYERGGGEKKTVRERFRKDTGANFTKYCDFMRTERKGSKEKEEKRIRWRGRRRRRRKIKRKLMRRQKMKRCKKH